MTIRLLLLFSLPSLFHVAKAQDTIEYRPHWKVYNHRDIGLGINRNPDQTKDFSAYHSIEATLMFSRNISYIHPSSGTLFISQELGYANRNFIHATKVGVWTGFWGAILGMEFKHYTDYRDHRIAYSPFLGFGNYPMRLSIGYDLILMKSESLNLSRFNLNFTLAVFNLKTTTE